MKRSPATPALTWPTLVALLVPTAARISFSRTGHAQSSEAALTATESSRSALSQYAVDLTELAAQGKLETRRRVLGDGVVPRDSAVQATSLRAMIFSDNGRSMQT